MLFLPSRYIFFFCNQKPAYEMRISVWSSDVCSSDLLRIMASGMPASPTPMPSVSVAHRSGAGTPLRSSAVTELVVAKATARQARKVQICAETVPAMKGSSARWSCDHRSEEHTSELQSLMRISYAVFCLKKKKKTD